MGLTQSFVEFGLAEQVTNQLINAILGLLNENTHRATVKFASHESV